ncbi:MAG: ciab protein, partial [Helicobacter sp.]|nr:ciab protein [Helicobacter sp.]
MEAKILHDVAKLYRFLAQENSAINMYYQTANLQNVPPFLQEIFICLPQNQEILLTLIDRVLSLREESLENVLKKHDFSKDRIAEIKDSMFFITEKIYKEKHEKILDFVQKEKLLTPFLRTL